MENGEDIEKFGNHFIHNKNLVFVPFVFKVK